MNVVHVEHTGYLRIAAVTDWRSRPRGSPSSRMFNDSRMMSIALHTIRAAIRIERIGSIASQPV